MGENNGTPADAKGKSKKLLLIVITVLAVVVVGYIIFLVFILNGKDKPSDSEDTEDPTKVTVWRMKEEKVELHPERTSSLSISDCTGTILEATGNTVYTFDEAGNPIKMITCDESGRETRREEFEYRFDSEGRWLQELTRVYVDGKQTWIYRAEFLYDDRGNRIETKQYTTPEGKAEYLFSEVKYEYNDDNLLVNDGTYTYEYNERGQQTRAFEGENLAQEFTYDDEGNLQKAVYYATRQLTTKIGVGDVISMREFRNGREVEPAVDEYGHPVREFDEDGNITKYTMYALLSNWEGDQSYVRSVSEYRYENGLLAEITTTYYNRNGDDRGTSRVIYTRDENGTVKKEDYTTKNVLTRRTVRDKADNILLDEDYTDEGELIFRVERSYVSYRVSIWALTNEEARNLGGIFRKYIY